MPNFTLGQFYRGGDLNYSCQGASGNYLFQATIFVSCPGNSPNPFRSSLSLYMKSSGSAPVYLGLINFFPSLSNSIADTAGQRPLPMNINNCLSSASVIKDVFRFTYQGSFTLPNNSIPPGGYTFFIPHESDILAVIGGVNCGLPSRQLFPTDVADNLMLPFSNVSAVLMARMLDFNGLNPGALCDKSPKFTSQPSPMYFNANAIADSVVVSNLVIDSNQSDSISYHLGGIISDSTLIPRSNFYDPFVNFNSSIVPNGFFNLNSSTGEFSFGRALGTSQNSRYYHWGVLVKSWRCGSLISEVHRDFVVQVRTMPSSPNYIYNQLPDFNIYNFRREIYIGDSIFQTFKVDDPTPIGLPGNADNYLSIGMSGNFITANGVQGSGIGLPALTSNQAISLPLPPGRADIPYPQVLSSGYNVGYGYSAINTVLLNFAWSPICDTIFNNCFRYSRDMLFLLQTGDYTPPYLGKRSQIFSLKIRNSPVVPPVTFVGVSVSTNNDQTTLTFKSNIDTTSVDTLDVLNNLIERKNLPINVLKAKSVSRRINSFLRYQILRSIDSVNWIVVGNVNNPFATTFVDSDPSLDLAANNYYYQIKTISRCGISPDTTASSILKTFGGTFTNNKQSISGVLRWGDNGAANIGFLSDTVIIESRALGNANWNFVKRIIQPLRQNLDSILPFLYCNDTILYRVGVLDNGLGFSNAVYWSRWIQGIFTKSDSLEIKYVSVDTAGNGSSLRVLWYNKFDPQRKYIDGRFIVGGVPSSSIFLANEPDSVWTGYAGISASSPLLPSIIVYSQDSCMNLGGGSAPHRVINVEAVARPCDGRINLSWRQYEGWNDLTDYIIYRRLENGPFQPIDTINGTFNFYSDTDTSFLLGRIYGYFLCAVNTRGFVTFSNIDTALYAVPRPDFCYIEHVSFDTISFSSLNIRFNVPEAASFSKALLFRKSVNDADWAFVDSLLNPTILTNSQGNYKSFNYVDFFPLVASKEYLYRVMFYNECNLLADSSNIFRSFFVYPSFKSNYINNVTWKAFTDFDGEMDTYILKRRVIDQSPLFTSVLVKQALPLPTNLEYFASDDVSSVPTLDGVFDYYVIANEQTNSYGFAGKVASRRITLTQDPRVFFPNAFYVGSGLNGIFRPGLNYCSENDSSYRLLIANRWGQVVFESRKSAEGWNGSLFNENEKDAPQDSYLYFLEFTGYNYKKYSFKGSVTLLRQ